jgi:uncharacterized protein YkwD
MGVIRRPIDQRRSACALTNMLRSTDATITTERCYRTRVYPSKRSQCVRAAMAGLAVLASACEEAPAEAPDPEGWPRTEACEGLDEWSPAFAALEADALAVIEARRAEGADCGERGKWGPAPALQRRTALDCAARAHALDMATQGYFGRLDPEGEGEAERVEAAGYVAAVLVQHLAAGPRDAQELVERTWAPRPVPCQSMADAALTEVGIGHVGDVDDELGTYWVLLLASPAEGAP